MSDNTRKCECKIPQYAPIIFASVAYQNSANTVYTSAVSTLTASVNGTRTTNMGTPIFKTNSERMQYLLGRQNVASCGIAKRTFAFDSN